jgi:hypothetical protein
VFIALGIQHAMRMGSIVICGLPGSTRVLHIYIVNYTILETKILNAKRILIFSTISVRNIFHSNKK